VEPETFFLSYVPLGVKDGDEDVDVCACGYVWALVWACAYIAGENLQLFSQL